MYSSLRHILTFNDSLQAGIAHQLNSSERYIYIYVPEMSVPVLIFDLGFPS